MLHKEDYEDMKARIEEEMRVAQLYIDTHTHTVIGLDNLIKDSKPRPLMDLVDKAPTP